MKKNAVIGATIVASLALVSAVTFAGVSNASVNEENISEDNIYATIAFGDGDTIIDMEDTGELYDYADLVVIGTVTEKYDATMSELSPFPYTPSQLKVDKVIKGEVNDDAINFYVAGGSVSVKDFIYGNPNLTERAEKMGLTSLSESEQERKYIQYISNHKKEYDVGQQYIIALKSCSDSGYTVIADDGFLELEDASVINDINSKEDVVRFAKKINKA
ncbi:MAG: hypothetical protein IJ809_04075 [Clostridia bacterium]|nr:hypothetical protein [Clostridia bacterium]